MRGLIKRNFTPRNINSQNYSIWGTAPFNFVTSRNARSYEWASVPNVLTALSVGDVGYLQGTLKTVAFLIQFHYFVKNIQLWGMNNKHVQFWKCI